MSISAAVIFCFWRRCSVLPAKRLPAELEIKHLQYKAQYEGCVTAFISIRVEIKRPDLHSDRVSLRVLRAIALGSASWLTDSVGCIPSHVARVLPNGLPAHSARKPAATSPAPQWQATECRIGQTELVPRHRDDQQHKAEGF